MLNIHTKKLVTHLFVFMVGEITNGAVGEAPKNPTVTREALAGAANDTAMNFITAEVGTELVAKAGEGDADAFTRAAENLHGNNNALGVLFELFKRIFNLESADELKDIPSFVPKEEDAKVAKVNQKTERKKDEVKITAPDRSEESAAVALATYEFKNGDQRAEHALNAVEKNGWMPLIKAAESRHGTPSSLIIAIIEAESECNPNAIPIDKKTGKTLSSAKGLSQMIDGTWEMYINYLNANPNSEYPAKDADRNSPKYAVDAIAWYCKNLETTVNRQIDSKQLPSKYKLSNDKPEHYYMAYHDGPAGYVKLAQFMEGQINEDQLMVFQRRTAMQNGVKIKAYDYTASYALRVRDMKDHIDNKSVDNQQLIN